MRDWRSTRVLPEASIREAIASIDSSALQIALVVAENDRLLGTVTDGDVRRSILKGIALEEPVQRIMNREPVVVPVEGGRAQAIRRMRETNVKQVPLVDSRGCLCGLEILADFPSEPAEISVVLMVGGLGLRLRPLTNEVPKPLIDVGGKPLLETIVEEFVRQGFKRIILSVHYKPELFEQHFGDGSRWGAEITYLHETRQLGTAGALSLLQEKPAHPIIVMNGDVLTDMNFRSLIEFRDEHEAAGTMCVREYSFQVPYGVVELEGQSLIGISEKPRHRFFVNAGIYVLTPEALTLIPQDESFGMPQLFEALIAKGQKTVVFPLREYWLDIGQSHDLLQAQGDFSKLFG